MKRISSPSTGFFDDRYVKAEDMFIMPPVEDFYDPTGGLPAAPSVGDRYIASDTANGWTEDYVYEWDGDSWVEYAPEEGWMIWILYLLVFMVFFSGGWMEVGSLSYWTVDTTQIGLTGNKTTSGFIEAGTTGAGNVGFRSNADIVLKSGQKLIFDGT